MSSSVDILNQYISVLQERRLLVATSLLNDNSPPDLQINTAAKNANNLVQIQAGIEAARKALGELTGSAVPFSDTVPIAPLE
ncbi:MULTISPECIES: hypothetical protein [Rhizobium]|uniref:Uncharacterized protein n=1 Tax=Rhizobium laguerreae TaxID=1076926 RepID=A0A7Y2W5X7_9HYPH|nr:MULTISPECIES: hypothetical protein [Rhizobium]MBY5445447.1 hypothetical protein [Rhizobium leguminosarum]NNG72772.1 hypothetical protein [Rhizobium laguerreae]NNH64654.1 hypothetical protein [Rhizobium laguerreae]